MSSSEHAFGSSLESDWIMACEDGPLGPAFAGVWYRPLMTRAPSVCEVTLAPDQDLDAHEFDQQVALWFLEGSLLVDGEDGCQAGDCRWATGGVPPASSVPAAFPLR